MFELSEFIAENSTYFVGGGAFLTFLGLSWAKNKIGAWWRGDNLVIRPEVQAVFNAVKKHQITSISLFKLHYSGDYIFFYKNENNRINSFNEERLALNAKERKAATQLMNDINEKDRQEIIENAIKSIN